MDEINVTACGYKIGRYTYHYENFTYKYDLWEDCGRRDTNHYMQLLKEPHDRDYVVKIGVVMVSEADIQATYRILSTLTTHPTRLNQD